MTPLGDNSSKHGANDNADIAAVDIALVLAENLRYLIVLPLAVGLVALGISFLIPPTFTATTKLLPPYQQQSLATALANQLGALSGIAGTVTGVKNPADMYVAMLQSRTIADQLVSRFELKKVYGVDFNEHAREALASRTRVIAGRDGLITVTVDDHDPQRAANLANSYVQELLVLTQTLAVTEAGQRRLFFEKQLLQAKNDLGKAELALRSAGINETTLNTVPESALEYVADLKAKVTAQEIKLASLRGFMTESNPQFKQAQNELAALRSQLANSENRDGANAGGRGADYVARLRDFRYQETLFELMSKQYELARLDEAREGAIIQVVDVALPPELKSRPRKAVIATFSTIVAFILTLLSVLIGHAFRNAAASPSTAEKVARLLTLLHLKQR